MESIYWSSKYAQCILRLVKLKLLVYYSHQVSMANCFSYYTFEFNTFFVSN